MPLEIITLTEKPYLLAAVLLVGAFAGMTIQRFLSKNRREAWRARNRWEKRRNGTSFATGPWLPNRDWSSQKQPDAADQLRTVMGATFTIQPNPEQERGTPVQGT